MMFKKPEVKRFSMQPRYWDPAKEAREERIKRAKRELGKDEDGEEYVPDLRGRLRSEYEDRRTARGGFKLGYTIRMFMILIMLFIVVGYLMIKNTDSILRFFGV